MCSSSCRMGHEHGARRTFTLLTFKIFFAAGPAKFVRQKNTVATRTAGVESA